MKKAFLFITLTLFVVSPAAAQGRVEFREGDAFKGPVRSARIEQAGFVKVGGEWAEGPRRLVSVVVYGDDGRRSEATGYDADGNVRDIRVHTFYEDGKQAEAAHFDAERKLLSRHLYSRDGNEILTLGPDGRVRQREVLVRADGGQKVMERLTYDGTGALVRRDSNTRDGHTSVWSTYDGAGLLTGKRVHHLDNAGGHSHKEYRYNTDGSLAGVRDASSDAGTTQLQSVETDARGEPRRKHSETREYDARRNLIKLVNYRWNRETGEMEPLAVTYYEINYF